MDTPDTSATVPTSPVVVITGANKGLGFETARRLAALGWRVWLGARDADRGRTAVAALAGDGADVTWLPLDVTSDDSVARAVATVAERDGAVDVLVNNAGIGGARSAPADTVPVEFLPVFGVNVLGPVRVTGAFLPLLRAAEQPRVVMVSSGLGSFGITGDPDRFESRLHGLVYSSSKAALNMITTQYARALSGITFTAVDPGYTATDLNGHTGFQTVTEGTDAIVAAATAVDAPSGQFRNRAGTIPW